MLGNEQSTISQSNIYGLIPANIAFALLAAAVATGILHRNPTFPGAIKVAGVCIFLIGFRAAALSLAQLNEAFKQDFTENKQMLVLGCLVMLVGGLMAGMKNDRPANAPPMQMGLIPR